MKKALRIVSFILVLGLMAFLTIKNINNNEATVESSSGTVTLTVVNCTPEAGDLHIKYETLSGVKGYCDSNTYTCENGTKIGVYFGEDKNYSLNAGYGVYCWAIYNNDLITPITTTDSEGEEVYKTDLNYTFRLTESKTIYVYAKTATSHVVSFYNSYIEASRSLIGFAFAEDGQALDSSKVVAPKQDGKNFDVWNSQEAQEPANFSNITKDFDVFPTYKYSLWTVWRDYFPMFFKGLGITLLLSVISVFLALFLGMAICFLRLSNVKVVKFIGAAYVEIIRGIPLLLQLLIIYIILGPTRIHIGTFFSTEILSCIIALFINSGAYTAEIFRSGIQAVDKGQMEAGRALGMSKWQVMFKVVMPQGIKNSLPSLGNELVAMIKETSLAVSVDASIGELMSVRKQITASTYINLPPYIIVAIIYFCVTFSLSKLIGLLEKRLSAREF